ncbi:hypothetical protein ACFWSO_03930, partial [Streptomyces sp. NPDC058572]
MVSHRRPAQSGLTRGARVTVLSAAAATAAAAWGGAPPPPPPPAAPAPPPPPRGPRVGAAGRGPDPVKRG